MKELKDIRGEHKLYGSTTVNHKGQVVIPAKARKELGINGGDRLLVFNEPQIGGLILLKADAVEQTLIRTTEQATKLERELKRCRSPKAAKKKET